jgi:hypothetical protein
MLLLSMASARATRSAPFSTTLVLANDRARSSSRSPQTAPRGAWRAAHRRARLQARPSRIDPLHRCPNEPRYCDDDRAGYGSHGTPVRSSSTSTPVFSGADRARADRDIRRMPAASASRSSDARCRAADTRSSLAGVHRHGGKVEAVVGLGDEGSGTFPGQPLNALDIGSPAASGTCAVGFIDLNSSCCVLVDAVDDPNELATIANDGTTCVVNRPLRILAANDRNAGGQGC